MPTLSFVIVLKYTLITDTATVNIPNIKFLSNISPNRFRLSSIIGNSIARKLNIIIPSEKAFWSRHEDWIIDSEIEQLDTWTIIHGDNIKKVYPKGIEFTGGKHKEPSEMLIKRIQNTGLKEFAPEIVKELQKLNIHMSIINDEEL